MWKKKVTTGVVLGCFLFLSNAAHAQDEGSLSGTITDGETGEVLMGANVMIEDLGIGSSADEDGNYLIENIPPGTYDVNLNFVGYSTQEYEITIDADQDKQRDFELSPDVLGLDQVLVTARGTTSARREIGSSMTSIQPDELEGGPIQSMSELLQGRTAGMNIQLGGGKVGQQHTIMMRGANSLSQSNEPVIYVDGVRIDNSRSSGIGTTTAGVSWSGLDDINPEDIENIEVIRGASAATLYGTEAASGVIQIFTNRGEETDPQFTFRTRAGVSHSPESYWDSSVYGEWFHDEHVGLGFNHSQYLSASGGFDRVQYYASGTLRGESGTIPNSNEDYGAIRANLDIDVTEDLNVAFNNFYSDRSVQHVPDANNTVGLTINGLMGGPAGQFGPTEATTEIETFQEGNRFTSSLILDHNPEGLFSHRATFGYETTDQDQHQLFPRDAELANHPEGFRSNYRRQAKNLNAEYIANLDYSPTETLRSNTSLGLQYIDSQIGSSSAIGDRLPLGALEVVGAGLDESASESRFRERSAGFFAEQQFGYLDRLFVTLGVRLDGHSAFGEDVEYQTYPKIDMSYMISESDFWPDPDLATLRLRAAYGTAGQQPGAFTAVRTWSPVSARDGQPGATTDNLGNPDLISEVSHELELGFDATFYRDLISLDFTYYNQRTEDALYEFQEPPSQGFPSPQLTNIGEVVNEGVEVSLDAQILRYENFAWNFNAAYGYNDNEVTDLGGAASTDVQWMQDIREGFPVGSFFSTDQFVEVEGDDGPEAIQLYEYLGYDDEADMSDEDQFIGSPIPEHTLQVGSDFDIGANWSARVMFDYSAGNYLQSSSMRWMMNSIHNVADEEDGQGIAEPGPVATKCRDNPDDVVIQANCNRLSALDQGDFVYPADFLKLRELSVTYELPVHFVNQIGLSRARFTLSGRNLWRWQEYPGLEAEANYRGDLGDSAIRNQIFFDTPIPRQFIGTLSIDF